MKIQSNLSVQTSDSNRPQFNAHAAKKFESGTVFVTQSGSITAGPKKSAFIPAALRDRFDTLEISTKDPYGTKQVNQFPIGADGNPEPRGRTTPLGETGPYQLSLVAKDGERFTAVVDVSPKAKGVRTQGSFELNGLEFTKERPKEFKSGLVFLSQSGSIGGGEGRDKNPLVPPSMAGEFVSLEISSKAPHASRQVNSFPIGADGNPEPSGRTTPLGEAGPYQLSLVAKDGTRFHALVDVSPRATGVRTSGFYDRKDITFKQERPEVLVGDQGMVDVADEFVQAQKNAPPPRSFKNSPIGVFFNRGNETT